jgi:D-3-phosphoglycerate dehydrogenase
VKDLTKFKVIATDPTFNPPDVERTILGKDCEVLSTSKWIETEDELLRVAPDVDAVLASSFPPIGVKTISGMPNLKIVSLYAIGFDKVDLDAATEKGVLVTNVPDYCMDEVADHAMALVLSMMRRVHELDKGMRNGDWGHNVHLTMKINSLSSKVLGLVAFGKIARRVAKRARAFGFRIVAYDPFIPRWDFSALDVERCDSLEELMRRSDIVSVHVPLNQRTKHLIGARELALLKPTAYIVNTSRGAIIDQVALTDALEGGKIAGAGLDVFETEPVELSDRLLKLDNVLVTPHVAGYSEEAFERVRIDASRAVADTLSGKRPQFLLNAEAFSKKEGSRPAR